MGIRTAVACQVIGLALTCPLAIAQDLSRERAMALQRLHQQQLEHSRKLLAPLLEKEDWTNDAARITALYGATFDDDLIAPLIARTDTTSAGQRGLVWHAIAYTQTARGGGFLARMSRSGSPAERALADACLAAAQLRGRGVQCDLNETGVVTRAFFPFGERETTAEDLALVARLPAVETLSIGTLAGEALEPLRAVTTLRSVSLGCRTPYVDGAIGCLRGSKGLTGLDVAGPVTDAAMPGIGAFSALTTLRLRDSRVTDEGLRHLERLTGLSDLDLSGSAITDAGLKHLRGLHAMVHLNLSGTAVRGQGLAELQDMHKLWALNLDRTRLDDRGLGSFPEFAALRNVRFLYLEKTAISDEGLGHLAAMTTAEGFHLSGNERVTSRGIARLRSVAGLKWVNCAGGRVSHAAAEGFAQGRPAAFYISYTTAPGGPIHYEKGRDPEDDAPETELLRKLGRPDRDGHVPPEVIDELASRGPTWIAPLLAAVKKQHGIYQDAGKVLHKMGPAILDRLVDVLRRDDDYRVASAIIHTFGLHGMPLLPRLRTWLADDSTSVRKAAADALSRLASDAEVRLPGDFCLDLLRAMNDADASVRQHAAGMLARLGDRIGKTAPALARAAATDADLNVRIAAAAALGQCAEGLDRADPILRQAVDTLGTAAEKDESFYVREVCVYYLQRLAPADGRALRALVRATGDEAESVRNKATDALKQLGHEELIGR
jgi:hypothetical protein